MHWCSNAPLRFQVRCFVSKPKCIKFDVIENLGQILHFSFHVTIIGGVEEMCESGFQVESRIQPVQSWCVASFLGVQNFIASIFQSWETT